MISISKEQAAYLRRVLPDVHITILCRRKSKCARKHRLVEEYSHVRKALESFGKTKAGRKGVSEDGS